MQSYSASAVSLLPPTLAIIAPPVGQPSEFSAQYIACARELLRSEKTSYQRPATSYMESGGSSRSAWQVPSILRRRRRTSSQELGSGQASSPEPSPTTPEQSSGSTWQLRRAISSASPTTSNPQDTSPVSRSPMNRRPSRLSSLIRRHQSPREEEVFQPQQSVDAILYHSHQSYVPFTNNPVLPPHSTPSRITEFGTITSASTISPLTPGQSAMTYSTMTFSPIANNPYESWNNGPRPHTIASSPTTYITDQTASFGMAYNPRGTSYSSAPAAPIETQRTHQDLVRSDTDPEAFTSPSDFALFAEATSSLSILSPSSNDPHGLYTSPFTVRPSSVPPPLITHNIAGSSVYPASTYPRSSGPSSTSLPSSQQQQLPQSRSQMIAEALIAVGSDSSDGGTEDEELPDYATSQAEASARRRREATRRARELEERWRRGIEDRWKRGSGRRGRN